MIVSYKNKKEEAFYANKNSLRASFNTRMAVKIGQRINELEAVDNPQQLPKNARFHKYKGKRKELFSIDLIHPFRLIVFPTCRYTSWVEIVGVEIYGIFNPHN